jgi:hypothetical protein
MPATRSLFAALGAGIKSRRVGARFLFRSGSTGYEGRQRRSVRPKAPSAAEEEGQHDGDGACWLNVERHSISQSIAPQHSSLARRYSIRQY